ncbi:hypothetical protein E2P81_ATG04114 [Venturia nashicola]|uniref:Uncharacterized protein n=1 Tax=Venturia nashicola TaxID=86259 RepID=A0A4Z1PCJ6_9PEZI|nr:hypothetical protein E6O75_ATG04214 [Venturia nashicola]TLD37302.1 hypothetical protein E2P81_ATG04114 [Venturia nashicola]
MSTTSTLSAHVAAKFWASSDAIATAVLAQLHMATTTSKKKDSVSCVTEFTTSNLFAIKTINSLEFPPMIALMSFQQLSSHGRNAKLSFLWSQGNQRLPIYDLFGSFDQVLFGPDFTRMLPPREKAT